MTNVDTNDDAILIGMSKSLKTHCMDDPVPILGRTVRRRSPDGPRTVLGRSRINKTYKRPRSGQTKGHSFLEAIFENPFDSISGHTCLKNYFFQIVLFLVVQWYVFLVIKCCTVTCDQFLTFLSFLFRWHIVGQSLIELQHVMHYRH